MINIATFSEFNCYIEGMGSYLDDANAWEEFTRALAAATQPSELALALYRAAVRLTDIQAVVACLRGADGDHPALFVYGDPGAGGASIRAELNAAGAVSGWFLLCRRSGASAFEAPDQARVSSIAAMVALAHQRNQMLQAAISAAAANQASEARYRALTEAAPDAIIAIDDMQRIVHFNHAAEAMFGYQAHEVLGQQALNLVPRRYHQLHHGRFEQFLRTRESQYIGRITELAAVRKDGTEFICEMALSVALVDDRPLYTAILRDTTQRRELERRMHLSARIFDSTQESIIMTDAQANILAVNPAFELITGYLETDIRGTNPRFLRSGRHDTLFYRDMWSSLANTGQWRGEIWNRRKNGQVYPERMSINAIRDDKGNVSAYVSVSSDISALKAAHRQVAFLSNHDPLTLLPNRALLNDRMQQALASAEEQGCDLAVLLFNIDRLQRVNESLGHQAGDQFLQEVARRVGQLVRAGDTLAHLGSDEFVLLQTRCGDVDEVIACARRLLDEIARPFVVDGHDLFVTASMGISVFPRDGTTPSELLKAADVALSRVKDSGRNGLRFFKGEMNVHALRWLSLETHLRRAVSRGELRLAYQPQVCLDTGEVTGMEALVRWNSPELGEVPTPDFIAVAEDTGLINPIGEWVMHEACRQNHAWHVEGLPRRRISVNVSAQQFMTGTIVGLVRSALDRSGMAAEYLEIELTESVMMKDSESAQAQLAELAAMGVSVSLDDFGTGFSSLGYLSRFSLDKLKIDQSFIRNITHDQRSAAIAQATIALARGLSMRVVAEGVEDGGQLDYLRQIGCDEVQGFFFSRPVGAGEMADLLQQGTEEYRSRIDFSTHTFEE
jgi:diguanylate cyclase (GGDEF)-like protein/PAS domain S-box-containing protein